MFSGTDGRLIYTIDDPMPSMGGTFGFSMSKTNYNGDSTPDLYLGQAPNGGGDENGGTYVMDGRNGSLLRRSSCRRPTASPTCRATEVRRWASRASRPAT